jgi:hypothetical protein
LFERKCGADLTLFFNGAELSWCRTVFFNGCRNVLVPNCLFQRVPELSFSMGAELSRCRTVFFNGCRTVLFLRYWTVRDLDETIFGTDHNCLVLINCQYFCISTCSSLIYDPKVDRYVFLIIPV